jgi:hypothetical protein
MSLSADDTVDARDLAPTISALLGVSPANLEGRPLAPVRPSRSLIE